MEEKHPSMDLFKLPLKSSFALKQPCCLKGDGKTHHVKLVIYFGVYKDVL